jgi:cytochrome P450
MSLPPSIPRAGRDAGGVEALRQNPLAFLERARREHGDIVALTEDGPLFSRASQCVGSIAVFGAENHRAVLSDIDVYGMPLSVSERFSFPPPLANLNTGLFSMTGSRHRERQQMLSGLLNARSAERYHDALAAACATFLEGWQPGAVLPLLGEMRRFALHVADRMLLGTSPGEPPEIGSLIQAYFHVRREFAAGRARDADAMATLVALGQHLDGKLRERLERLRGPHELDPASGARSVLEQLVHLPGETLSDDELVAHANVLFMSSSEPVAVALTWTLLLLTQLPELRAELGRQLERELGQAGLAQRVPGPAELERVPLLDAVVRESLRLLPPSAILARLSRAPSTLAGHALPAWCEVVLSPYVAHRDPARFPQPACFRPQRWKALKPGPFEYFPFGAGGRYCLGRHLAMHILKTGVAVMLQGRDVVLAGDQALDWRMNVTTMPAGEPMIELRAPGPAPHRGGRLSGAVTDLVDLSCAE